MTLLLSKQIDVAEAMIYNEYAQVLEAKNPETGELYKPTDLNVINYNDVGTRDAPGRALRPRVVARRGRATRTSRRASSRRRSRAGSTAATNPADCVQYTVNAGSTLGAGHQAWMMNEINPLVWPSPNGIGMMDPAEWQQSVDVALGGRHHQGRAAGRGVPNGSRDRGARRDHR